MHPWFLKIAQVKKAQPLPSLLSWLEWEERSDLECDRQNF